MMGRLITIGFLFVGFLLWCGVSDIIASEVEVYTNSDLVKYGSEKDIGVRVVPSVEKECQEAIEGKFKKVWVAPEGSAGKVVMIRFRVDGYGGLLSLSVDRASGFGDFDESVLDAVKRMKFECLRGRKEDFLVRIRG